MESKQSMKKHHLSRTAILFHLIINILWGVVALVIGISYLGHSSTLNFNIVSVPYWILISGIYLISVNTVMTLLYLLEICLFELVISCLLITVVVIDVLFAIVWSIIGSVEIFKYCHSCITSVPLLYWITIVTIVVHCFSLFRIGTCHLRH